MKLYRILASLLALGFLLPLLAGCSSQPKTDASPQVVQQDTAKRQAIIAKHKGQTP